VRRCVSQAGLAGARSDLMHAFRSRAWRKSDLALTRRPADRTSRTARSLRGTPPHARCRRR
jgi:hypothetical protein